MISRALCSAQQTGAVDAGPLVTLAARPFAAPARAPDDEHALASSAPATGLGHHFGQVASGAMDFRRPVRPPLQFRLAGADRADPLCRASGAPASPLGGEVLQPTLEAPAVLRGSLDAGAPGLQGVRSLGVGPVLPVIQSRSIITPSGLVIQRLAISDVINPWELGKWAAGRGARGATQLGLKAAYTALLGYLLEAIKQYARNPFVVTYLIQAVKVLEALYSGWKALRPEIQVTVKYLAASLVNWMFGAQRIPAGLITEEDADERAVGYAVSLLQTAINLMDLANKPVELVANATTMTLGWLVTGVEYVTGSGAFASGFKDGDPPLPEVVLRGIEAAKEKLRSSEEQEERSTPEETEKGGTEEEQGTEDLSTISLPPLKLFLHEMSTRRGSDDETGGLAVNAGFRIKLFDYQFPKELNDQAVEVLVPWVGSGESLVVRVLDPVTVIDSASVGTFSLQKMKIENVKIVDKGLESAKVSIERMDFGSGTVVLTKLGAGFDKTGMEFTGAAGLYLPSVEVEAAGELQLDPEGNFERGALTGFKVGKLPTPFETFSIASAAFDGKKKELTLATAKLVLEEGYGVKDLALNRLVVDAKGDYEARAETNLEPIELWDGALSISDLNVQGGIKSVGGERDWDVKGSAKLASDTSKVTASGRVALEYKDRALAFTIAEGQVKAQPADFLELESEGISYTAGVLGIEGAKVTATLPNNLVLTGEGTAIKIDKTGVDWEKIGLGIETFTLGDVLKIENPRAAVYGRAEDHKLEIGGGVELRLSDYFHAGGSGVVIFNPKTRKLLVEEAGASVGGGVSLPGDLLPLWPLSFEVYYPIVPGLEAHGGIKAYGGVAISLEGSVDKKGAPSPWVVEAGAGTTAQLGVQVELGVLVGSGYVAGISGDLYAGVEALAEARGDVTGGFTYEDAFRPGTMKLAYKVAADLEAMIGGRITGHAFYVFHKKLYEVEIGRVTLGHFEMGGARNFDDKGRPEKKAEKLSFVGESADKANSLESQGKVTVMSDEEALEILRGGVKSVAGSGEKRQQILEKALQDYKRLIDGSIETIDSLLRKKLELEGSFRSEDFAEQTRKKIEAIKKNPLASKQKRLTLEQTLAQYEQVEQDIFRLRQHYLLADAIGITIRVSMKDPVALEVGTVDVAELLNEVESGREIWETAIDGLQERLRKLD